MFAFLLDHGAEFTQLTFRRRSQISFVEFKESVGPYREPRRALLFYLLDVAGHLKFAGHLPCPFRLLDFTRPLDFTGPLDFAGLLDFSGLLDSSVLGTGGDRQ